MSIEHFIGHEDRIELLAGEHWVAKKGLISFEGTTSDYRSLIVYLKPGQKFMPHWHTEMEEIIYVLAGEGTLYLNDIKRDLKPGHIVYNSKYLAHTIKTNGDKTFIYLVFILPCKDRKKNPLPLEEHIRQVNNPVKKINNFNIIYDTEELIPQKARYFGELKIPETSSIKTCWEEEAICYTACGKGNINLFGENAVISQGSVMYIPPNANVNWQNISNQDMSIICLRAEPDFDRLPEYYKKLCNEK